MYQLTSKPNWTHSSATPPARTTADRVAAVIVLAATVAATSWTLAVPALGVDLAVGEGDGSRTIGLVSVVVSTLVAALVGWAALVLLGRWSRGRRTWAWAAATLTVLSLVSPLTMADSAAAALTLSAMHVAVAAVIVPGLLLATGSRR